MHGLDAFSPRYAKAAMDLYLTIRGGEKVGYEPERDEIATVALPENLFTGLVPWNFGDPALLSEFLLSWGQMLRALDLRPGEPSKVLEYGAGTGQLLLILARLGFDAYGVDINASSIAAVEAQARQMKLRIRMEQAAFGEGFNGELFDRIVFFEAFHHAFDFMALLARLRGRLKPGGKLILCGEPIIPSPSSSIPYAWGPRLDGLSAFCIQRFGWMELGFTWPFLREAMRRSGWQAHSLPMMGCGRADCYVATPVEPLKIGEAWSFEGGASSSDFALEGGWSVGEGSHRWSVETEAYIILPAHEGLALSVEIALQNYLPLTKHVAIKCGDQVVTAVIAPDTARCEINLLHCVDGVISIESTLHCVSDVVPGSADARTVGIALLKVTARPVASQL